MNKELKRALKESFEAPAPVHKKAFFRSILKPPISTFEFVCTQVTYIRKWVWGLSAIILATAFIGAEWIDKDLLWCISSFMPLLALAVLTECGRAEIYGMVEFELSTRFSMKSVVLARLGIIGISTLILLCVIIPFTTASSKLTLLKAGVYIICPYLLTVSLGFWTVRKIHGKESFYVCTGIAVAVSGGNVILSQMFSMIYQDQNFIWWIAVLMILCLGAANQCYKMINQTEELAWNL